MSYDDFNKCHYNEDKNNDNKHSIAGFFHNVFGSHGKTTTVDVCTFRFIVNG